MASNPLGRRVDPPDRCQVFATRNLINAPLRRRVHANPELINSAPFAAFLNGVVPGGEALVGRTFFDQDEKLGIDSETLLICESSSHDEQFVKSSLDEAYRLIDSQQQ